MTDPPSGPALTLTPAAAAIILDPHGRYLLQLRDDKPAIWYPAHWGLFGGAIEAAEDAEAALRRELAEELGFAPERVALFGRFVFELFGTSAPRHLYEVRANADELAAMQLGEGREMRLFEAGEVLGLKLVPYDAFALFLHVNRARITPA
jgi:8-oxo-dGTP pyrophosphatase MutT (NUDIX family)